MAPNGAGARTRCIKEDGVERAALPLEDVGFHDVGAQIETGKVLPQPLEPARRAIDCYYLRPRRGQLCGFAAGGSAQVGNHLAAELAKQSRRQRCGRVLHPPRAFAIAEQCSHASMHGRTHRARRQHAAAQHVGPMLRLPLDAEIERGLPVMRGRNRMRRLCAVVARPARHEPVRRIECRPIELRHLGCTVADNAPEHGVDEPGISRSGCIGARELDGEVHSGVVGYIEP